MFDTESNGKSCTVQHLLDESPSSAWDLARLSERARQIHERITGQEKNLAAAYWLFGQTLMLARRHFHHGSWETYLRTQLIEKTRAFRAIAIFRTFPRIGDLAGRTMREAYAARFFGDHGKSTRRRRCRRNRPDDDELGIEPTDAWQRWLNDVGTKSTSYVDEIEFVPIYRAAIMLEQIDKSLIQMTTLRDALQRRITSD